MLNNVRIFKASVFNSELTRISPTLLKHDSRNSSQGDSQGFRVRSYDLVRPGVVPPLVGVLSALSFHLYSAADMSTALLNTQ